MAGLKTHTWRRVISVAMVFAMILTSMELSPYFLRITDAEAADSKYTLVWSDEFNGSSLDTNYWTYEYGNNGGWGNNELQYYTDSQENCFVSDGALHIVAKEDSAYSGYNYTSTRIKTSGKVSVKYGRVEARIKVPQANGVWPAFWMLGESIGTVGWPKCGEIDIMECVNNDYTTYGTAHWDADGHAQYGQSTKVANMDTEYHVYAVEWDSEYIYWYVDDTLYNTIFIGDGTTLEEMHDEYFIILNVAVGGNWPGFNIDSNFNQEMTVDYVRVYEQTGSSSADRESSDGSTATGNLLSDTALSNSANNWYGDASVIFNGNGTATANIGSVSASDENWSHQLKQDGLTLKKGKWYKASFTANSSVTRDVQLLLQNNGGSWAVYGSDTFGLTANQDTYCEVIFQMTEDTDTNILYGIMMGNVSGAVGSHSVTVSNVSLMEYDTKPASDGSGSSGNGGSQGGSNEGTTGGSSSGIVSAPNAIDLGAGSIAPEVVGTWSYWDGSQTVVKTNASLLEKLPYEGSPYRYTTENYDANHGAFDTTDWATSFAWDLDGDNPYSSTVYAIPLAFRASVEGGISNCIQVTAPSALSDYENNTYTMQMPANGSCTDFFIETPFSTSNAKVDAISDWAYDVVLQDVSDANRYMKTTMVQGSIFAYFEMVNANSVMIERGKQLPASVVYTSSDGKVIIVRCYDNAEEDYDYYAFYGANGTSWNVTTNGSYISKITGNFSGATYFSMAYLGSSQGSPNDSWASSMADVYYPYAYNFVTDTQANYEYDEATSTVKTVYSYTLDKKAESTGEGTVMGILPHQYKNMTDTAFLPYTYETIRGTLKLKAGSSFTTYLKYSGILPYMPDIDSSYDTEALSYLDLYVDGFSDDFFANYEGSGDTYWDGKGLNRLVNAMAVAYDAEDTATGDKLLEVLKGELENWFTYSGSDDDAYFYYDEGVGSLFGFPQSYNSVDQMNDHHFHYGYFIYAAAQLALRDKDWGSDSQYGTMVKQLIYDIACPERNSADSAYPYLRGFAPYEGHSWASGHGNFEMGNNQESSSEALNAWAGIILWGEATGDTELRDLGIYLYTTEASAVDNYWYDVVGDVLHDAYKYDVSLNEVDKIADDASIVHNSAAIVWGGSYCYATWFDGNPLYIQGINLLPMNPTGFYLAGDKDYIQMNYNNAYKNAQAAGVDLTAWSDIYAQYLALADPDAALNRFNTIVAEGHGVEGGDSRAHTYHFIQSLRTHGTPDTTITSNTALSTVFYDEDTGVYTYVVYNTSDAAKTVTFSDGTVITAAANDMTIVKGNEISNRASYTTKYYVQNANGSYDLYKTAIQYGVTGSTVNAAQIVIEGYSCNTGINGTVMSGSIAADGSLSLALYYNRNSYTISYELNGGTNSGSNPSSYIYGTEMVLKDPVKSGYKFTGWYTDSALSKQVTSISPAQTGDITLYAGWADPYTDSVDSYKGVTYRNGTLTFYVKNVDVSDKVFLYTNFYADESKAMALKNDTGVAGLPGYILNYDSQAGMWTYSIDASKYAGYYVPYRFNVVYASGGAELSAWGVYQIPVGGGSEDPSESESSSESKEDTSAPEINTGDYVYDAQTGKVTFTLKNSASQAILYLATYSSESEAVSAYNTAVAALPGISLPGHAGYIMEKADDIHTYIASMAEGTYFVYAFNAIGTSGFESWKMGVAKAGSTEEPTTPEESSDPDIVTPSIVTGVQAVYADGKIQITWENNGAAMYKVVRSDGRNGYENLTYSATAAGWTDAKGLVDAQLYYYRVIGYFKDADGNLVMGDMSDAVGVVATDSMPEKIVNVQAAVSGNQVTLTWDKANGARYYKVSRAAGATGMYYTLKYNIEPTSYTDSNVAANLYRYKVVGYYKDVDGSWVYGDLCDTLYVTVK